MRRLAVVAVLLVSAIFVLTYVFDLAPTPFDPRIPVVLWKPVNQLGNCLRSLSSSWVIAQHTQRQLLIQPTKIGWESPVDVTRMKKLLNLGWLNKAPSQVKHVLTWDQVQDHLVDGVWREYLTNFHPYVEMEIRTELLHEQSFMMETIYAIKPVDMSLDAYVKKKREFYGRTLREQHVILARRNIDEYRSTGSRVVGIHIRAGDNWTDLNKNKAGFNTPVLAFRAKVLDIQKAQPSCAFFLCTDNPEVAQHLPPGILRPKSVFSGYEQALWEQMLLSQCDHIIGSASSTFTYEALFMNPWWMPTLEVCERGSWRTYDIDHE
jgi:hypothetical protein